MTLKLSHLNEIRTFVKVKRLSVPKGAKILSTRMVARGFRQEEGIDYSDTFAAVVKAMSFKTLFATVARKDHDCEQCNIITAFLNSLLKEEVCVKPPEGYREEGYVWLLK